MNASSGLGDIMREGWECCGCGFVVMLHVMDTGGCWRGFQYCFFVKDSGVAVGDICCEIL